MNKTYENLSFIGLLVGSICIGLATSNVWAGLATFFLGLFIAVELFRISVNIETVLKGIKDEN